MKTLAQPSIQLSMQLGECPRWNNLEQAWYWVDIRGNRLYRCQEDGQKLESQLFDFQPACFGFTNNNEIFLTSSDGIYLLNTFGAKPIQILNPEADLPGHRFNDGVTTPTGDFIAGSISDGETSNGSSYLFEFKNSGVLKHRVLHQHYKIINGQAFSPDGHWYYVVDTPTSQILKYPFNPTNKSFGAGQLFYQFKQGEENPDGAAIDSEGNYWVALYGAGKVCVISPQGERVREIILPVSQPTMVAFGGPSLNILAITSARQNLTPDQCLQEPLAGSVLFLQLDEIGITPALIDTKN